MLQLIYELRKNWRGRVDGWRIEGSTRGPRGPKNVYCMKRVSGFQIPGAAPTEASTAPAIVKPSAGKGRAW